MPVWLEEGVGWAEVISLWSSWDRNEIWWHFLCLFYLSLHSIRLIEHKIESVVECIIEQHWWKKKKTPCFRRISPKRLSVLQLRIQERLCSKGQDWGLKWQQVGLSPQAVIPSKPVPSSQPSSVSLCFFLSEPHGGVGELCSDGLGGGGGWSEAWPAPSLPPQGTEHLLSPKRASLAPAQLSLYDNHHA